MVQSKAELKFGRHDVAAATQQGDNINKKYKETERENEQTWAGAGEKQTNKTIEKL